MPLYLLPPSEGKATGGSDTSVSLTVTFDEYPESIATKTTKKDLKCTGSRYKEAIAYNKTWRSSPVMPAIERYTGVFYKALDYDSLPTGVQGDANETVVILSGLFGMVLPQDMIPNYKLPIEAKGLLKYRKPVLTSALIDYATAKNIDEIIDLLPGSYRKMIDRKALEDASLCVSTPSPDQNDPLGKTHMIKKWRGARLRNALLSNQKAYV